MAYQYTIDINYSNTTNFSEMEFIVPGPGAIDGIRKCFAGTGGLNEAQIIRFMAERQELEFARLGLDFQSLWGRRLQLIDCQNLFCEVDKYARVRPPRYRRSVRADANQAEVPARILIRSTTGILQSGGSTRRWWLTQAVFPARRRLL